jgi:hypothetical protein
MADATVQEVGLDASPGAWQQRRRHNHQFTKPAQRADQAAFAHTMKAPAPSLSLGGGSDLQS